MKTTVACVKYGKEFGPEYVNRLFSAVRRNRTHPFRPVCLTDDPHGIDPFVKIIPLPASVEGWWGKLYLFSGVITDRMLYFDLDTVIVDSIDFMSRFKGPFCCLAGFQYPFRFGFGVISARPAELSFIWTEYYKNPTMARKLAVGHGDGAWMNSALATTYPGGSKRRQVRWSPIRTIATTECRMGPPLPTSTVVLDRTTSKLLSYALIGGKRYEGQKVPWTQIRLQTALLSGGLWSNKELLDWIYGDDRDGGPLNDNGSIWTAVYSLRKQGKPILNVFGQGYYWKGKLNVASAKSRPARPLPSDA